MMRRVKNACALASAPAGVFILCLLAYGGEDTIPQDALVRKNPVPLSDAVMAKARQTYADNCLQCHGEKGKGDGPMAGMLVEPPADLTNGEKLAKLTDGELFWNVSKGRVPVMPPFESKLPEEERWSLIHLLRDLSKTKPNNTPSAGR